MPGEILIFIVGTVLGLSFAIYKLSQVSWRFLADLFAGKLRRDKYGKIEDPEARKNIEKIRVAGMLALVGIIGGPLVIIFLVAAPFVFLGATTLGLLYWIATALFKRN